MRWPIWRTRCGCVCNRSHGVPASLILLSIAAFMIALPARNFSDPVAREERVFRVDGFHNLVDTGERVLLLLTEDEFCDVGFPEPGSFD